MIYPFSYINLFMHVFFTSYPGKKYFSVNLDVQITITELTVYYLLSISYEYLKFKRPLK